MESPITDQDRDVAYAKAPKPIKDTLSDGPLFDFFTRLETNYRVHADTIDIIIGLVRDLLLGLINPTEFFQNLQGIGIPSIQAQQIANDLNVSVFIPLHEQMVGSGAPSPDLSSSNAVPTSPPAPSPVISTPIAPTTVMPPSPVATPVAAPAPVFVPPAPRPLPPVAPTPAFIPTPVTVSAPETIPAPMPAPVVPTFIPAPAPTLPTSMPAPMPRTMMGDMKEAKEHPDRIHAPEPIAPYVPAARPSVQATVPQSAPVIPAIPSPQPTSAPQPMPQTSTSAPRPAPKSENKEALHELLKSYGVDPYREPAE